MKNEKNNYKVDESPVENAGDAGPESSKNGGGERVVPAWVILALAVFFVSALQVFLFLKYSLFLENLFK